MVKTIAGYEIVDSIKDIDDNKYDYEEMTLGEFLNFAKISQIEQNDVVRKIFAVNIHHIACQESFNNILETLEDIQTDPRLSKLNAIVLLSLKQKGRGINHTPLSVEQFKKIIDICFAKNIRFGCDSCTAHKLLRCVEHQPNYEQILQCIMPCESTLESLFVDVNGMAFPCSFTPDYGCSNNLLGDIKGINLKYCNNFLEDVWYHPIINNFRNVLLNTERSNELGCRTCPLYKI